MTHSEISALEHASRAAMAWTPEGYDGKTHVSAILGALLPAVALLLVAAVILTII